MVEVVRSPNCLIAKAIQRFFLEPIFQHLPIRAFSQANDAIARLFITDKFDFSKTLGKQKAKANTTRHPASSDCSDAIAFQMEE
ncbi:hypothetical protein [Chlorogloeopsis sp. ULAP02]|uniref:hypothetical protein n=1 Tax=Chlorogloeopsis sp. ULAP02 TaxID=3107926 RepID=UPI0031358CE2